MYNKNNIALHKVASPSTIREELACVAFYGDRTVATDSFRLIEMSATGKRREKPDLYTARSLQTVKLKKGETVDDKTIPVKTAATADGDRYPEYEQLFTRAEDKKYAEVKVNAAYLAEICTILKGLDPFQAITLKVPTDNPLDMIIMEASGPGINGAKQTARALLMPFSR